MGQEVTIVLLLLALYSISSSLLSRPDPRLRLIIRALPVVLGIATLGTYLAHWLIFDFDRATLNLVNRVLMVLVAGFALTIVVWQAFEASETAISAAFFVHETA